MGKILSKSGDSLADVYDVEGSIAGIDELLSKDVNLVHEMGETIFSERLIGRIFDFSAAAVNQNLEFSAQLELGARHARLLGITVFENGAVPESRVTRAQVSITSAPFFDDTDSPIWYWDTSADSTVPISIRVNGANRIVNLLQPSMVPLLPNLAVGSVSPFPTATLSLRGLTSGFGAGDVTITVLVYHAFPELGGLSSRGLPLPGW